MKVAILTVSDSCARGAAEDTTGPGIAAALLAEGAEIIETAIVPDDMDRIRSELVRLSDEVGSDVVFTNGGTGFGPRDVTPEATDAVLERRAPGLAEAMRSRSLVHTPQAMLSRAVAGLRGRTLIINLPGSPRGARECLAIVLPVLPHALAMIAGGGHPWSSS
ncbi:MAG: MogA/MoaB family molybdenum cofactor biosynthesis protein [Armatimonadetes bacterium]|nr:MogA/MoaB family molybdenum cofactor biosynthesis protein [Armatimonadota bacterium]